MARRKKGLIDRDIELLAHKVAADIVSLNRGSAWIVWLSPNKVKIPVDKIVPQYARGLYFKNRLRRLLYEQGWSPGPRLTIYEQKFRTGNGGDFAGRKSEAKYLKENKGPDR